VVLASTPNGGAARARAATEPTRAEAERAPAVIWHDLECGRYRADLPLWRELADAAPPGPVLEIGAGTGRVALELARHGRRVIALDRDARLLAALRARAKGLPVESVCADARTLVLRERGAIALCVVPMQAVQLLGGPAGRLAFLRRARAHLRPGGLLACALVAGLEPFDCTGGGAAPSAEEAVIDGVRYVSQALRVQISGDAIEIERERLAFAASDPAVAGAPPMTRERDVVALDRLRPGQLAREGAAAGLRAQAPRSIVATDEHTGSTVVVLRA
jgi:SAM-dependent methyltransferase